MLTWSSLAAGLHTCSCRNSAQNRRTACRFPRWRSGPELQANPPEEKYETIAETLTRIGYAQRTNAAGKSIPASFQKTIKIGDVPFTMQIDFLAGEYGGTAKSRRHQKVQEMLTYKGRGADLVFDNFYTHQIQGNSPTEQNCMSA